MRITGVAVHHFPLTRKDREWRTSSYGASLVDAFAIEIHTDEGVTGVGGTSIMRIAGETPEGFVALMNHLIAPFLIGKDPFDIEAIMDELGKVCREPLRAHVGVDLALYDLMGKALNVPVYKLIGGAFRKEVPIIRMVGIKEPAAQAKNAADLVDEGYRYLKLKIGLDPEKDVQRVAAVRKAVGDDVVLTIDANGAYRPSQAIWVLRRLEPLGVVVAEEPTAAWDLDGQARVRGASEIPIMADQSANTMADAINVIKRQSADVLAVKVSKTGGILASKKFLAVAEAANMPCHIGSTATTRLLEAGSMHVAVTMKEIPYGCELGEFEGLEGDPVEGLSVKNGMLRVPEGPGLGVTFLRERVAVR